MEIKGWNYDNARTNGKNIFLFRDTGHEIRKTQEDLTGEISNFIDRNYFRTIFFEGFSGYYGPDQGACFSTDEELRSYLRVKGRHDAPAINLLLNRYVNSVRSNQLHLIGVDSEQLLNETAALAKRYFEIQKQAKGRQKTLAEVLEIKEILESEETMVKKRSDYVSEFLPRDMDRLKLETAALIYGDRHFSQIHVSLLQKGLGVISYYPGEEEISEEDEAKMYEYLL